MGRHNLKKIDEGRKCTLRTVVGGRRARDVTLDLIYDITEGSRPKKNSRQATVKKEPDPHYGTKNAHIMSFFAVVSKLTASPPVKKYFWDNVTVTILQSPFWRT